MSTFTLVILFIIGLCWGSFLNVLILRTISGESIITPASKCPHCNTPLANWQKIPLISYFILKGKCYYCNGKISLLYPVMELVGAAIVLFAFITNISKVDAVSVTMILSMFLVMSATDIVTKTISTNQILSAALFALILNRHDLFNSVAGGLTAAILLILIIKLFIKYMKVNPIGTGDVYLAATLGCVVGFDKLFLYLIYALLIQFLFILPKYIKEQIVLKNYETLKYLIIFAVSCLFLYFLKHSEFVGANVLIIVLLGVMLYFAFKLSKNLTNSIKNSEKLSYSPFTPALAISCLIFFC